MYQALILVCFITTAIVVVTTPWLRVYWAVAAVAIALTMITLGAASWLSGQNKQVRK